MYIYIYVYIYGDIHEIRYASPFQASLKKRTPMGACSILLSCAAMSKDEAISPLKSDLSKAVVTHGDKHQWCQHGT